VSIPTRVTAAAFFAFALVSTTQGHAHAPVQVSTQAQALPADDDFNALRGPAATGDAQVQFAIRVHFWNEMGSNLSRHRQCQLANDLTAQFEVEWEPMRGWWPIACYYRQLNI
jgi:hypothetical protein